MNIKQLRYFSTIAEEGQITRAAKKLYMAQPPLSQQLKLLEEELGVKLMQRNGRNLELTEAGIVLYKKAKKILQEVDETITEVKETGEGLRGMLSIGSVKTCFYHVPPRMLAFRQNYPKVTFKLIEGDTFRLQRYLLNRDIELAVVRLPLDMKEFSSLPLPDDKFVVVMSEEWGEEFLYDKISIEKLSEMPLLLLHRAGVNEPGLYELVLESFKERGFEPNVVCDCPDAAMLLALAKTGVGAALLPASTLRSFPPQGVKVLEIENAVIQSESAIIWLKDRYLSKNAARFLETFKGDPDKWSASP
ncbi:LysR family transcriptional regulator [Pseudalkalibacillus caeni]|uniref:LysR family transcriptional regulator n=1 Tax=Exobacillus caeni TaxID=2574798 RepID=A0A5R9FB87_9BACL|nr:LysR family transcriptional regulator [Pseudalkalibacillus caeni]TLS36885.1 LysR family transcriptional regulator [Pseudalkalibacillus caeni]